MLPGPNPKIRSNCLRQNLIKHVTLKRMSQVVKASKLFSVSHRIAMCTPVMFLVWPFPLPIRHRVDKPHSQVKRWYSITQQEMAAGYSLRIT
jgi:hypothetical protein